MKRAGLLVFILLVFTKCTMVVPYEVKKNFDYCFDGNNTGLDSLIRINGYFYPKVYEGEYFDSIQSKDTLYPSYVFYSNGFVHVEPWYEYLIKEDEKLYFGKRWADYGIYILVGDTIKLKYINPPGGMSREMAEIWFKIIDSNTIQKIYQGIGDDILSGELPPLNPYLDSIFTYSPLENKIEPEDTWIMKKKWFHCKGQ